MLSLEQEAEERSALLIEKMFMVVEFKLVMQLEIKMLMEKRAKMQM